MVNCQILNAVFGHCNMLMIVYQSWKDELLKLASLLIA